MTIGLLSWIAFYLWMGTEWLIALRTKHLRKGVSSVNRDQGSYWMIMGGVFIAIFLAFLFHDYHWGHVSSNVANWGAFLMIAGSGFRLWAISVLGRHFALSVCTENSQTIVEKGPYRIIRHPAYTGSLITLLGLGLAMNSWLASVLIEAMFWVIYWYRIEIEEQALMDHFGAAYEEYRKRTWRLVPYLW